MRWNVTNKIAGSEGAIFSVLTLFSHRRSLFVILRKETSFTLTHEIAGSSIV